MLNEEYTDIGNAVRDKNVDAVTALIKAGADVNQQDFNGDSLLQWAIYNNDDNELSEVIKALIKAGADVNTLNRDGYPPLEVIGNSKGKRINFTQ